MRAVRPFRVFLDANPQWTLSLGVRFVLRIWWVLGEERGIPLAVGAVLGLVRDDEVVGWPMGIATDEG